MRIFAIIVSVTLTLAATAPARVVSLGGEPRGALPPMSKAVALVVGFASKKVVDYALRRFEKVA